jgi:hypothetical protein
MDGTAVDAAWAAGTELSLEEAVELGRAIATVGPTAEPDDPSAADGEPLGSTDSA